MASFTPFSLQMFVLFSSLATPLLTTAFISTPSPSVYPPAPSPSPFPTRASQLSALLAFKTSIDPSGKVLFSWNTSSSYCDDWLGITCTFFSQGVVEINLFGLGLEGTLSPQIGNLTELSVLVLSQNKLSGSLPSSLGQMENLQELVLFENRFSGSLPSSLGQIESLQELDLSANRFSGPLPTSFGEGLINLLSLDLSENQLSGSLPPFLGQKENLYFLDLSANRLSGPLPTSFGEELTNLNQLNLSGNQLSGPLPSSLGQMRNLQTLDLSANQLFGPLPSFLGQIEILQTLDLSANRFSGPLRTSFGEELPMLTHLDLSGNQLSGQLPSFLGQMENLQTLDLSANRFSGPLSISFGEELLTSLSVLDLSGNQLSDDLPSFLQRMNLSKLDLSRNYFSGSLPSSFGQAMIFYQSYLNLSRNQLSGPLSSVFAQVVNRLGSLDLSHNQFSGSLPSSLDSPDLSLYYLDVSYNRLQGLIPLQAYQRFPQTSFLGNPELRAPDAGNPHKRKRIVLVVVCTVGIMSLLGCLGACMVFCFRSKDRSLDFVPPQYKAWTAEEMRVATNNFCPGNVIGFGATSVCYLGAMKVSPQGLTRMVALKRLIAPEYDNDEDADDDEARKSFVNECKTLCKLRHRNLVKVMGYCVEGRENFALVMEYMEGGDLERRLHMQHGVPTVSYNMGELTWEEKVNVALNVAEGLVYLHHEYEQPIIHCDIKPKNILLGADMVAKISDFGIARLVEGKGREDISMSKFRGSFGYIAPEYGMGLRITTKVDVYSYGMLLLELVTGVRPTSPMLETKAMNLQTWCKTVQGIEWITSKLQSYGSNTLEEANMLLKLGIKCTHDVAKERPTMYTVRDCIVQLKSSQTQDMSLI